MPELLRETDDAMLFGMPSWVQHMIVGLGVANLGVAVALGCMLLPAFREQGGKAFPLLIIGLSCYGLFSVFIVAAELRIDELALDLTQKVYRRRRGYPWGPEIIEGRFSDFEGLQWDRGGQSGGKSPSKVQLVWSTGEEYTLGEWRDESKAKERLMELAGRLGLQCFHALRGRRPQAQPGEAVASQPTTPDPPPAAPAGPPFPEPPPGLRMQYSVHGEEIRLVLEPGFTAPARAAICASIVVLACLFGWLNESPWVLTVMGLMGVIVAAAATVYLSVRESVSVSNDRVAAEARSFGIRFGEPKAMACAEIEDIKVEGKQVVVESKADAVRIGSDTCTRAEDKQWMSEVMRYAVMVTRPQFARALEDLTIAASEPAALARHTDARALLSLIEPPPGLKIKCSAHGKRLRFVLPARVALLKRVAGTLALAALLAAFVKVRPMMPAQAARVMPALGLVWLAALGYLLIWGSRREIIFASPHSIDRATQMLGTLAGRMTVDCDKIISLKFDGRRVVVRSGFVSLKLASTRRLPTMDKHWLSQVLQAVVGADAQVYRAILGKFSR